MATTAVAVTPPPVAAEYNPFTVSQPEPQTEDVELTTNHPSSAVQSQEIQTLPSAVVSNPAFIHSITELKDIYTNINTFLRCYDDLFNHLDTIRAAILSKMPSEPPGIAPPPPLSSLFEAKLPAQQQSTNSPKSELEGLCEAMCSRDIKKYLVTHISDRAKLLEEVPKALKLAPNPAKLVLECVGKFFSQGSKAYTRDSPMIHSRAASIFILECFLLMMGMNDTDGTGVLEIEESVKQEADAAALAWRKRLVVEGGVSSCNQVDARGLLMFVACFGIPTSFKREDIADLVAAANAKEIVGVLKNSRVLMDKIPEIVEGMLKSKMEVDAVDIAYTFGFEERFNPRIILSSFLRGSKESSKKAKRALQGKGSNGVLQNEANKKQLAALKSVRKCLEKHEIDAAKLLPGWQISEKISTLETDISDFDRKAGDRPAQKRKASDSRRQDTKRSRYTGHSLQQQKVLGHVDNRRNLLYSAHPIHASASHYSATPPVVYGGPSAGMIAETVLPPGVGGSLSTAHGGALSTMSYARVHEAVPLDPLGPVTIRSTQPNMWLRDEALIEKYASQPSSVGLTSLYRGFPNPSDSSLGARGRGSASDLYKFRN